MSARQTASVLGQFMAGRLLGYLVFAVLAWRFGQAVDAMFQWRESLMGLAYTLMAASMLWYGLHDRAAPCAAKSMQQMLAKTSRSTRLFPLLTGLLTGINLCPPFLIAFTVASSHAALFPSLLFFLSFFLGTSLYFFPVPLFGTLSRFLILKKIGKLSAGVLSVYYFYVGLLLILGGAAQ